MTIVCRARRAVLACCLLLMLLPATDATAAPYQDVVNATSGLRTYWRLGETFGTTAAAVRGPAGTYVNAPFLGAPSLLGSSTDPSVDFTDASNHHVRVAPGPTVDLSTAFTLEAWVRIDAPPTDSRYILCKGGSYALGLDSTNDLFVIFVRTDGAWLYTDTNTADRPAVGQVMHVVGTYDGYKQNLWVNGRLVDSEAYTGQVLPTPHDLNIGGCYGGESWEGAIDEPAIYDRALTDAEIQQHYDVGSDGTPPSVPTGLKATPDDREVALDWASSPESDTAGYRVYRATASAGPWTQVSSDLKYSSFTDTAVTNGTTYYYNVRALDRNGNVSAASATVSSAPAASTRYRNAVTGEDGLQGYWRLNETSGTSAAAQYGAAGAIAGAPAIGAAGLLSRDSSRAIDFDGVDDQVNVADSEALDVTTAFTVEAWVRPDAAVTSIKHVLCKANAYCLAVGANGTPHVGANVGGVYQAVPAPSVLATGSTYHLAGTYDGAKLRIYVNGTLAAEGSYTGTVAQNANALEIGAWLGGGRWNGVIDEPAVYDTALSATAVRDHFQIGGAGTPPAAPGGVTATAGDGLVSLDWSDSPGDVVGYDVYRGTIAGGPYTKVNQSRLTASRYTDTTAANGATYRYVVKAVDRYGRTSAGSAEVSAKPRVASSYRQSVASNAGLRAYWRFDETNGGLANAEKGPVGEYVNHPALGSPSLLLSEPGNTSADFLDDEDHHVRVTPNAAVDLTTAFSLEAWIRIDQPTLPGESAYIICKGASYALGLDGNGDLFVIFVKTDGQWLYTRTDAATRPAAGQRLHVVGTYDGAAQNLYVNGALVSTRPYTGQVTVTTTDLNVGGCYGGENWDGIIDEPAIYGVPLSAAQVKEHYDLGSDNTGPARPASLSATNGDATVALDWPDSTESDLAGYDVYRSATAGGPYTRINASRVTVSAYTDSDLQNGKDLFYVVKAVDKAGNASVFSPEAKGHPTTRPVLVEPETLHADGAELRWTPYDTARDGTFDRYEVHRSASANFTPSTTTLLATIRDAGVTTYRDTTARGGATFTYKLTTNGSPSGEWTVTLPADGQARKRVQPDAVFGRATYLREGTCANRGGDSAVRVGSTTTSRVRGLVAFDVRDVPATVTVSKATLSLYAGTTSTVALTVGAHAATGAWLEGTGRGTCTGDGATWSEVQGGVPWKTAGGDFDPAASASVARLGGSAAGWDDFDLTAVAQKWVSGQQPNHGVVLKAADETLVDGKLIAYHADGATTPPTLRPRLTLDYADGSRAQGPTVELSAPAAGERVSGSSVRVAANANDDRRVDRVQFLDGATTIATDTSAPFEVNWNTSGLANGTHTLKAIATDDAGNVTSSSTIDVNVANSAPPTASVAPEAESRGYAATVKADNPAGYYRLDEAAGSTVAADSSGNARNGTYVGSPVLGQAGLTGDGNTAVKIPDLVSANVTLDGLSNAGATSSQTTSVEAWLDYKGNPVENVYDNVVERSWGGSAGPRGRWIIFTTRWSSGEHACFTLSLGGGQDGACGPIKPGRLHLVGTYDGERVRLYANGMLLDVDEEPGVALDTTAPVQIGASESQDLVVDDVAMYNGVLTPGQIQSHYDAANPGAYDAAVKADGPAGYWRLGESSGTALADASGAGRTATLSGAATLGQPSLLGRPGSDTALRVANDASGDGKATVSGLTGLLGSRLTAEAWVDYPGVTGVGEYQHVMSRGWGSPGGWRLTVYQSSAATGEQLLRFEINNAGTVVTERESIAPGRRHLVVTYDGANMGVYVDGVENAVTALAGAALTTTAPLEIGGGQDSGQLVIDEPAVFDKVLSWDRIREHFIRGRAPVMESGEKLKATATDDGTVSEVEFLIDGKPFAKVTAPPYEAALPAPTDAADPAFDGTHVVTTRTTDNHGKTTTSNTSNVVISNAPSDTRANIESSPLPDAVVWNPAAGGTQEDIGVDVPVFNTGDRTLKAADTDLRYRWVRPDGTTAATGDKPLPVDVGELSGEVVRVTVPPPPLLDGVQKAKHQLQFDLVDRRRGNVLSTKGNKPKDKPVEVERKTEIGLGLERFYHYEGEQVGGGVQHVVNLASGNSLVRFTPFDTPGRGLNTVLDLTYNSLEDKSRSPAGNNVSLAISGLTPLGMQLDPHPNKADEIAGKSNKYVEVVDADGTRHRFEGKNAADGTTYWEEPPGVHLYLRVFSNSDRTRKWALTRPDRVTFFFDEDGFPTSVEDRNGNRITYRLEETPPGEDPGGPKKRITAVTDPGGQSFGVSYFSKAEAKKAHVRGKIKRITDHSGSPLDFEYYEDGNLRRLVQRGGTTNTGTPAQGVTVNDRAWVFTYTTSAGDGPALTAAERVNPPEKVGNQSTRLFSVRDPRGHETTFTYLGPGNGNDRWKIASRTDRANATTTYAYDTTNRVTTVTKPLSRVTKYAFDADGKVTQITNPKNELIKVTWTGDRHVSKVTDPHLSGTLTPPAREFTYNDNGYMLTVKNQAGEQHCMTYQNVPVDANDVLGKWKTGRTIEHISQVKTKETPKGCATATPDNDFETVFDYDAKGNLIKVTDPEGKAETTDWRADGTISKVTDPKLHATSYTVYDVNGLPTTIVDAKNQTTRMNFDADGLLRWVQDPNHQNDSGGSEYEYKTFHHYDAFHRPVRQSSPKSTRYERKQLIWSGTEYDANDNATAQIAPHYGQAWSGAGARTTTRYDVMDRPDLVTMPDTSADPAGERMTMSYDLAGRLTKRTLPRGVQSATVDDFTDFYEYDLLDRVVTTKRHEFNTSGAITRTLRTHRCFETDGDVKSTTYPKANQTTPNCDATGISHRATFEHDAAHRQTKVTKGGLSDITRYDLNGNVREHVDRKNAKTELFYDQRDLLIKKVQPLDHDKTTGATTRPITTLYEYDAVRNVSAEISPRAFDAAGGAGPWDTKDYVKRHTYDELDRLTRTEQPSRAGETKHYVHVTYDANGNQLSISQPVANATSAAIEDRENRTYFDPGWIRTSQQGSPTPVPPRQPTVDPMIRWDYRAEGWPTTRAPDRPTGGPNEEKRTTWEHFVDGQVKAQHDRGGQLTQYGYDADDNLTSMTVTRSTKPTELVMSMSGTYDSMDRQSRVRQRKQGETNWKVTTFAYDEHSNLTQRFDDIEETDAGTQVKAGRRHDFVSYDQLDRLLEQIDYGPDLQATTQDDRQIKWTYNEVDMPLTRVQRERDMAALGTPFAKDVQTNLWEYTSNNRRKKVETKNHAGTVLESHTVAYTTTENGRSVYLNGNKATDTFTRKGPDASMPCQTATCSNTYGYDGRDRMISDARRRADMTVTTDYKLSPSGNIEEQGSTPLGDARTVTKSFTYSSNNQIQTGTIDGESHRYHYKDGNLDCVTTGAGSASNCSPSGGSGGSANLVEDYSFDTMDRMEAHRSYNGGSQTSSSTYTHDALDRLTEQTTTGGGASNTTKSSYLGLSSGVSKEESSGSSGSRTKQYSYDASGQRIGMSDTRGAPTGQTKQYGFGHDADGNVSQLVNQSQTSGAQQQGQPQASYGYSAYGDSEEQMTRENDPVTGSATTDQNPLNAYRFESRRYDTASKSLEMGARRYSPTSAHFVQQDFFESAVSDMGLSQDPLTSNRYSFEGANPVNFVEVDGHGLLDDIEEGAEDVKDTVEDGVNSVRNKARDTARSVRRKVSETASDAKRAVSDTASDVSEKAGEAADSVADKTRDIAGGVRETASNVANDVKEGAQSAGRGVANGVKKASDVAGKVSKYGGWAAGAGEHLGKGAADFGKKFPGKVSKWTNGKISPKGLASAGRKVSSISKKAGLAGAAVGGLADFAGRVASGENVLHAAGKAGAKTAGGMLASAGGALVGRGVGMAAGAAIGSIVPGAGTAAGAAIGGAIGQAAGSIIGGEIATDEATEAVEDTAGAVGDALGL